ncbi:ABC transporter permease [Clostridium butyricum]|uniref:ABC transporter permease n=1 Tax=Clostridium butyricum TaxID=1492 RepID=UPI001BAD1E2A|nr:ABC transporter permease [Clostridium butyricum]QUF84816.1 ABC transporter permease [Clostridium butyricum]
MISLIYSEFLKLKRSSIIFFIAVGSSFMPLLLDAAILMSNDRHRTYESYMYNSEGISFTFMHGILFSIIAAYIFSREFNYKTSGNLYSYSYTRNQIFSGKLIVVWIIMIIITIMQWMVSNLGYCILFGVPEWNLILIDMLINIKALLFQIALVSIPVLIVNITNNIIMPVMYSVVMLIFQLITSERNFKFNVINPLLGSTSLFAEVYGEKSCDIKYMAIYAALIFLIFTTAGFYYHKKMDIN